MAGDTCEGYSTAPAPAGESSTTYNGSLETQFGCYPRTSNISNPDRPTVTRTAGTYKEAWPITNSDQQTHAIVNCTLVAPTSSNGEWKATRSF